MMVEETQRETWFYEVELIGYLVTLTRLRTKTYAGAVSGHFGSQ